jgi:hypothetical protein
MKIKQLIYLIIYQQINTETKHKIESKLKTHRNAAISGE